MSGRNWKLGLLYTGITTCAWGVLPIALKAMLSYMDPYTITWYRFLTAALIAGGWLAWNGSLPRLRSLDARDWWILSVAIAGLTGNYLLYLIGLSFVSPGSAQVLIQLAPLFLLLGGLVVFRESFGRVQWLGLAVLISGLLLFFHDRLGQIAGLEGDLPTGVALMVLAALVWAAYALAQKFLLATLTSQGVLLIVYVSASLFLLPSAAPASIAGLSGWALFLLAFCSINTLVAYGSFGEALRHWEASRISAVISLTPLLTILFATLLDALPTGYRSEESLDLPSLLGALLVILGSAACALGGGRRPDTIRTQ